MAEAQKETSSLVNLKEKKSSLDDGIGKEFLNSWKLVSATEDVTLDFNLDSVPSGKEKKFNFGKLDMDFNLEADFDKFSSFKVVMPDLDFTSSPKKTAKAKEGSKGESSKRSHQGQKDCFGFSLDFNELENFDFGSSLINGEKSSKRSLENKQVAVERKGLQGSLIHLDEGIIDNNLTTKLPASEIMATSNVETLIGELGAQHSLNETCASESRDLENLVVLHGVRTSQDEYLTKHAEEKEEQSQLPDKATPLESNAEQTLQIASPNFVGQDERDQNIVPDIQTEACSQGVRENTSSVEHHNFSDQLTPAIGSKNEKSQSNCALPSYITGLDGDKDEARESGSDIAMEKLDKAKSALGDINLCDKSVMNILMKPPDDTNFDLDVQTSAAKLPLVDLESEPLVEKVIMVKGTEPGLKQSKYFKKSDVSGSELQRPSLTAVEVYSHGSSKPIGSTHISPTIETGEGFHDNDVQTRRKLMGISKSITKEITEGKPNMAGSDKNNRSSSDIGSGEDVVGVNGGCKLAHPALHNEEERKGESVAAEKFVKDHKSLGSEVSATCSTKNRTKSHTRTIINPKLVVTSTAGSIQNSKIVSVEGIKVSKRTPSLSSLMISSATCSTDMTTKSKTEASINPKLVVSSAGLVQSSIISDEGFKTGKRTPDFSNISRYMGPKRGQSYSRHDMEVQGNAASRIPQPLPSSEKKMPLILSLKRKMVETSDAEFEPLKPLKRLSITPTLSRNIKEPAKSVVDQISVLENLEESKVSDHPTSRLEKPPLDMIEQEVSMVMEDDGNVGKAEIYTRDLEHICNMLKKKHEEAKEILVRAVVNNNNLLMLNHPLYEDKIRSIQKFAAQLMSKHLQMLKL
ncbi:uncharacterized protein At4g18490 isoform X1 [Tripterygium wilfordii]|uniref:uncharacterized protein At4g18490 isoform X1 n=1 Tax=Tripterygium wilfordii TaxID=458696 RepID=UPI0018F820BA|nr:uncharacterized protein At4g18490 isoform X1 [Tripterygium wilfordii]